MTTHKRTTLPNLAGKPNSTPDALEAARMYLSAKHEGDDMRIEFAGRHLELIEYFQRLNTAFPGYSEIPERGEGRRSS
jgi:hypothetical protein